MKIISVILAAVLSFISFSAFSSGNTVTTVGTYGIWNVNEFIKPDGTPLNCAIQHQDSNGTWTTIYMGYTGEFAAPGESEQVHWKMGNTAWDHAVDTAETSPVTDTVTIGTRSWVGTTISPTTNSVELVFPLDSSFVPALTSSSVMTIDYTSGVHHSFDITGVSAAWAAMTRCRAANHLTQH
jgi:hypothetical protein